MIYKVTITFEDERINPPAITITVHAFTEDEAREKAINLLMEVFQVEDITPTED